MSKGTSRNKKESNPAWKGGRIVTSGGYIQVRCEGHPRATKKGSYVFEHIIVMEKHIGRYLKPGEVIHHRNENKQDNSIDNLELLGASEHHRKHPAKKPFKKGERFSAEHRHKISEAKKQYWKNKKS